MRLLHIVWILFGFTLAACASNPLASNDAASLVGPEWQLVEIGGKAFTPSQQTVPTIQFLQDQRVAGHSGCNRFFGGYQAAAAAPNGAASLSFSAMGATKMACMEPDSNQREHQFLTLLQQVDRYVLKGDQLTLNKGDEVVLRFALPN